MGMKCPRGDPLAGGRQGATFEVNCPKCGAAIEFFRDDKIRRCPDCGERVANPRQSEET